MLRVAEGDELARLLFDAFSVAMVFCDIRRVSPCAILLVIFDDKNLNLRFEYDFLKTFKRQSRRAQNSGVVAAFGAHHARARRRFAVRAAFNGFAQMRQK